MTIFVSVASYCDPDLVHTILVCLRQAEAPQRLRFGICWQHRAEENIDCLRDEKNVRVIDCEWDKSDGLGWARAQCMSLWNGEEFYLQIDSHHRFVPGWDRILLDQFEAADSNKPILTAYAADFQRDGNGFEPGEPFYLRFGHFDDTGVVMTRPARFAPTNRPLPARFVSGHFLFAPGTFVEDVPYDPDIYFWGEEITVAVRAFTHGYDLYHPSEHVMWHRYGRQGRPDHFRDHLVKCGNKMSSFRRDHQSRRKAMLLLECPWVGHYGLGSARTLAQYEAYAGIDFRLRVASAAARDGDEPREVPEDPAWANKIDMRVLTIAIPHADIPATTLETPLMWQVELYEKDITTFEARFVRNELADIVTTNSMYYLLTVKVPFYVCIDRWSIIISCKLAKDSCVIAGSFSDMTCSPETSPV